MPNRWPAHLMFLSLLWQNGGEPFAERREQGDVRLAGGGRRADLDGRAVGKYGPSNVAQDSQYVAFKNGKTSVTWDGIWQINDLKAAKVPFALSPDPDHRPDQGGLGELPQLLHHPAGLAGRQQAPGGQGLHRLDEQEVGRVGRRRHGARAQVRARVSPGRQDHPGADRRGDRADEVPARRSPACPTSPAQTLEIAVADAILGKQKPDAALKDAAAKATKLMQANKKKYEA